MGGGGELFKVKRFVARYSAATIMLMGTVIMVTAFKFFLYDPPAPTEE
ncbi:hypothetical protein SAMN06272722_110229 [Paenibacillus sp. RU5A]|nr:hypothetical protein SAMN06272722_110229 [Paenibacillus sp. RU5A]SOC74443.1 hypothetical protein SAMN05880581_110229 [Paenibacillus sp. RU26A]SOC76620.1 hypothetical protein SAMN05880586_110229 [Paenibacillus sp. RU5M]